MGIAQFTKFLLRSPAAAICITFLLSFIPLIGTLGIVIAGLVTLCKGPMEGFLVTIAATIPLILTFLYASSGVEINLLTWLVLSLMILSNLLTYVFAIMLRRGSNWSLITQLAALIGVFGISVIHLLYPNIAEWWGLQFQSSYAQTQALGDLLKPNIPPEKQIEAIDMMKGYVTGSITAAILLVTMAQLIAARWWQAFVYEPGTLGIELRQIRLSRLAGVFFMLSLLLSYLGNKVVLDTMPILYFLFLGAGFSLIHYLIRQAEPSRRWFWLTLLYLLLFLSLSFGQLTVLILITTLAFVDIWYDIRKRAVSA